MRGYQTGRDAAEKARLDALKAANKGKATPEQVDKAIQQELIQRTITTPRSAWLGVKSIAFASKYSSIVPW